MRFIPTPLRDAYVIELEPFQDNRGMFARIFCKRQLESISHTKNIVQINHSMTLKKGTLRGLHYQRPPRAETKIVKCVRGSVFDVIVDLRKGSPTFLKWYDELLSAENMKMMYIPEGFAHGFQTLEPNSELLYLHTEFFSPEHEGGISYNDPLLNIDWPLAVENISEKDKLHPLLDNAFEGF
jgi:dTDP-4-dehydrorhamnose 3,5-epimerase